MKASCLLAAVVLLLASAGGAPGLEDRAEVLLISPLPSKHYPSRSVVLASAHIRLPPGSPPPPPSWALAITLDEGQSVVVSGSDLNGELPGLSDGWHTLSVALIDSSRGGSSLGPRARVTFLVGSPKQRLTVRITSPSPGPVDGDSPIRITAEVTMPDSIKETRRAMRLDGEEVRGWVNDSIVVEQPSPGLHYVEVDVHGGEEDWELLGEEIVARDKVFFQVRPKGGGPLPWPTDDGECCDALQDKGGVQYVAPEVQSEKIRGDGHARSGAQTAEEVMEEYCLLHERIMSGSDGESSRFLLLEAASIPLGNRLQFLASGLLFAVLTRRALVVDMGSLSIYFEGVSACGSRWNFQSLDEAKQAMAKAVGPSWGGGAWEEGGDMYSSLKTKAALPIAWAELLTCTDLREWRSGGGVISMISNQNFVPFLASNPYHTEMIYGSFGHDIFGHLLRWLMIPTQDVLSRIERMLGRAGNKTVIGLQVRLRYGTSDSRCTYEIDAENGKEGRVPTYSHITDGHEELLMECGATLARGETDNNGVMFYISSDTPDEVTELAAEKLGWANILQKGSEYYGEGGGGGVGDRRLVGEMLSGGVGGYSDQDSGLRAVLDVWMLSKCHDLVITPSSTYGMMASALRDGTSVQTASPVYPTKWGKCLRALSGQPFSHSWLRIRRVSCYEPQMLAPEFDMLCPDCALWSCPCDGANPCASHTEADSSIESPRFTAHLPI